MADKDPFAEFGGEAVPSAPADPFAEFGGMAVEAPAEPTKEEPAPAPAPEPSLWDKVKSGAESAVAGVEGAARGAFLGMDHPAAMVEGAGAYAKKQLGDIS